MDPRRARDPRLARADPRLQQPQPQQQQQSHTPIPNNGINSNPGSHSVTPPQPFVTAIATVSSQILPPADASTSALTQPLNSHSPASLKTRPLFCVVCASNQVSGPNIRAFLMRPLRGYYRTGPWKVTSSCSERILPYFPRGLLDHFKGKPGFVSSLTAQGQLFDYQDLQ